ncbi:hypothetical protein ACSBR1_020512 [Camellia fascicularis]
MLSKWKLVAKSMSLGSCLLPFLLAVALTGACSASLNVFARSSGFLVLRGVIRFGAAANSSGAFLFICAWGQNFAFCLAWVPVLPT